jgi:glutamine transport system substrate-binding protein
MGVGKMKKTLMIVFAALLMVAAVGCGAKTSTPSSTPAAGDATSAPTPSAAPAPAVTYMVASDATYAPMEFMDKDKVVGFDIDFLDAVMKEAGLKYEVKNLAWDTMLESVKQGKEYQAGISSISITDDRKPTYDFSIPYFESTNMILVKEGSDVKSAVDLKGKTVAVQGATTADTLMSGIMGKDNTKLKRFDSNAIALLELDKGGADAVVADIAIVREYIKNNPSKKFVGILDSKNFNSEYYGIAFPKGSDLKAKVDPAIKKVFDNGKYKEIYKKWFGEEPNMTNLLNAK